MAGGVRQSISPSIRVYAEYLVYLFFRFFEEAFCMIPGDEKALALGRFFGRLMFVLGGERTRVALRNLTTAFGSRLGSRELRTIARKNFEHLGMLGVEFFRIRRWSQDELAEKLILEGHSDFNLAWSPGNTGILYVTAHFGSFEVLAAMSRFLGIRGNLVVTPAPNRFVNERMFFRRGGDQSGLNILPHRRIVARVIELLRGGEMVVVLADQRGDDTRPIWVDFFGRKVLANGVFAKFAAEGHARAFPITAVRTDDGRYRCIFGKEIPLQVTGDTQADLVVNSQRFHKVFETWLREHPEQGFWMHRKFERKKRLRNRRRRHSVQASRVEHERGF
ncbi:MAG: lysophospholipid acyltransferase family protein [Desulfomonilaceae bacterium]|nr:lysophospholipid acyltransferase family protein [Desulfomonilaceae bacterium]